MLDDNFFFEEERCGHIVTSEVKKLWSVQLSCLAQLQVICKKHNLKYYACAGTLLGAVRHKGYIPWDDDIDVCMFEEDYLRFCEIAPQELKSPFFFQNYRTQPGYGPSLSRIRRSDTTGCTEYEKELANSGYNCGIFIDIFPLFSVSSYSIVRRIKSVNLFRYRAALAGYEHYKKRRKMDPLVLYWKIVSMFSNHEKLSKRFLKACSSKKSNSRYVAPVSFTGMQERYIYEREWFSAQVEMPFETTTICCPSQYDAILRQLYGDYTVFVKGTAIHSMAVIDTETPYTEKLAYAHKNAEI